jgi:DNA-binding PadR family transcriptional regulator
MRTHAQQEATERIDAAVLAALGHEPLYIMDIRKRMPDRRASQPTIFSSLARLVKAGKAVREEGARPGYNGRGPEPTVYWRRV